MKILIADDDSMIRKLLEQLLARWGYQTVAVADGTEALEILQGDDPPKVAILDWTMPGYDGVEVCRRLRQQSTPTPVYVILVTGRTSKTDVVAGLKAGANDYIAKPFDSEELRARIQVGWTVTQLQLTVAQRMREFQDYVEDAPLAILVVEHDGMIGFANSCAYQIFQYEPGELIGQPIEILVPTSLRERHVGLRENFFQSPQHRLMSNREILGRRKDNSTVTVAVGLNAIRREMPPRVVCTVSDLTEQKRAEEQLQRFFDLSLDLFTIANVDGSVQRINANQSVLLGYSIEELLAQPFYAFMHPDDIPSVRGQVQRLAEGEVVIDFRCRLCDSSGNDHWIEWNARSVPEEGTIYAVGRNITERLRMESALLYRERRERAILDNMPAAIYVKGIDGRYEFVNRRHAELFSHDQEEAVGKRAQDFFPEEVANRFDRDERQVIETGQVVTVEETETHKDGVHTYVSVKFPLFDPTGQVCATAGISTDITEQLKNRETEKELALARSFQSRLYPQTAPPYPGLEIAGAAIPLTYMCGDYYDYLALGPNRFLVAIGDVSGHGIGPALQMVEVRSTFRTLARQRADLTTIMCDLNSKLCEDLPDESFVTFFLADIDVENRKIQYLGAGHDASLIRADGAAFLLESPYLALGILPDQDFQEVGCIDIHPHDLLFLFTDGVNEAENVEEIEFSRARAVDLVSSHRQEPSESIRLALFHAIFEYTRDRELEDDITAVVVKFLDSMPSGKPNEST